MASKKISALPEKTTLVNADEFTILDSADAVAATKNKRISKANALIGYTQDPPAAGNKLRDQGNWVAAGGAAVLNVGTAAGTVAAGDRPAAVVTTHEGTYTHANLPTTAQKAALDAATTLSSVNAVVSASVMASAISAAGHVSSGGALGTPSSGTLTNCTGLPNAAVIGLGSAALTASTAYATAAQGTDARTPTAHATSHKTGGTDAIKLDELAAPTDITTLNATASAHGLLPKLGNTGTAYLRDDGTWQAVSGGSATQAFGTIVVAGQTSVVADAAPDTLTLAAGANVTLTTDASTDTITIAASGGAGVTDLSIANAGVSTLDIASSTGADATIPAATASAAGLATAAQITKLDSLFAGFSQAVALTESAYAALNPPTSTTLYFRTP